MPGFNIPLRRGETLDLSGEFGQALGLLNGTETSYFITGKAGTGKSTLLRYYSDTTKKNHALLAPTGLAAVNIGGETIHSFFRFPPEPITQTHIKFTDRRDLYKALEVLVIDEVSMVRADLMDGVDQMLRLNREQPSRPFGGVQLLLFGDIFQLAPVVESPEEAKYFSSYYTSPFFFSAKVFQGEPLKVIDLQRVYRQRDVEFIRLLDSIRVNSLSEAELSAINSNYDPCISEHPLDQTVTLTATNQ
ncbi:MAG: AAA family ATPase, partial [Chloroflexi bacterium]|nr:AAA family ATPase [Chloroflexota bacterium]